MNEDIEGLDLYKKPNGDGFLVASSQGSSTFVVYERTRNNRMLASIKIVDNRENKVDGVSHTDGLAITSTPLPGGYRRGVMVVQDDFNSGDDSKQPGQNLKLVSWDDIAPGLMLPGI